MVSQFVRGLCLLLLTLGYLASHASTLQVEAPIVSVEPVLRDAPPVCDLPPPARSEGLIATLRWDLLGRCRESDAQPVVTGYQVNYEWDGQRFSTLTKTKPKGKTLPLRLEIN